LAGCSDLTWFELSATLTLPFRLPLTVADAWDGKSFQNRPVLQNRPVFECVTVTDASEWRVVSNYLSPIARQKRPAFGDFQRSQILIGALDRLKIKGNQSRDEGQ
jgi:hypothetical protein